MRDEGDKGDDGDEGDVDAITPTLTRTPNGEPAGWEMREMREITTDN
jgi:hypothetical protein